jgi:CheY-like chemotaxis protein
MTTETTAPNSTPRAASQRVMYIDDEAALVQLTTRMLQRLGYVVEGFTHGEQAIEAFRTDPTRIDLVVTDFSMPGMSGLDLARELLAIRSDIRIVLTSGHVSDDLVASSRRLGIRHVIYKADTVKQLCETLHRVLSGAQP